jgi:hypothetical protein
MTKSQVKRLVIWVVFLLLLALSVYAGSVLKKDGIHVPTTHRFGVTDS